MTCRVCATSLKDILDLGYMPLANNFTRSSDIEKYPLKLSVCPECKLIQLSETIDYKKMFEKYPYFSSSNAPMVNHFHDTSNWIMTDISKNSNDLIVEIGCNDGSFLQNFVGKRRIIGIDPAFNFSQILNKKGIDHICGSFNQKNVDCVISNHGKASVIYAANVLAHISDLNTTLRLVCSLLDEESFFIFEVQDFDYLIQNGIFDQIYHEHIFYFTINSITNVLNKYSLKIHEVKKLDIHGKSLRIVCKKVKNIIETNNGNIEDYYSYSSLVNKKRNELIELLSNLKYQKQKIVGYGAPAKAAIISNYLNLSKKIISYTIDNTVSKQHTYIPGTDIFIHTPEHLYKDKNTKFVFLFSWNYSDYILQKESILSERCTFIIPFPEIRII